MDVVSSLTSSPGPCPLRHQEETWMTSGVLTWFLMSDLDETFTESSDGYCLKPNQTIRNQTELSLSLIVETICCISK